MQFMRDYPTMCAEADRLTALPVKTNIEVHADDFERETATRAKLLREYAQAKEQLAAKDAAIQNLVEERERFAMEVQRLANASTTEVSEWVRYVHSAARLLPAVSSSAG